MSETSVVTGLAASLLKITDDPQQIAELYSLLGDFYHRLRNRLNSLKLSLYLARRLDAEPEAEVWRDLDRHYRALEVLINHLQTLCRPIRLTPIRAALGQLLEERARAWGPWLADRGRGLELVRPESPAIGLLDPSQLGRGLDDLVRWRAEAGPARTSARLSWGEEDGWLLVDWFEPAARSLAVREGTLGSTGLALPVLARIVSAHGGALTVNQVAGLRIRLRWPGRATAMGPER